MGSQHHQIPTKTNRVLYLILVAILLLFFRIWHLSVVQYEKKLQESRKPQQKTVIEPAVRATINDRFGLPLAVNKMSYQATILYSQLKEIPTYEWQMNESGKRVSIPKRRLYIRSLSEELALELGLDADRIEDLIYSKASFYSQVPFVIKENLTEREYYRLKMKERERPGIHVRKIPRREYPLAKCGADLIGYMGAINKNEYEKILYELKALEVYITDQENGIDSASPEGIEDVFEARKKLRELQAKAYSMHDYVGKTGIEEAYEKDLRGYYGKKIFQADSKGNHIKEFPGSRPPLSGSRLTLTLSSELQAYAEQLLVENEEIRAVKKSKLAPNKKTVFAEKDPWIKGGAIVVMEPSSGDILALASYPRFDPNDFVLQGDKKEIARKKEAINQWFENPFYISNVWNLQQPLKRERYSKKKGGFYDEERWMTLENYLDFILAPSSSVRQAIERVATIEQAMLLQEKIKALKELFPDYSLYSLFNFVYAGEAHEAYRGQMKTAERVVLLETLKEKKEEVQAIKRVLDPYLNDLPKNYDKVLVIDLCSLFVDPSRFSKKLRESAGKTSLSDYRLEAGVFFYFSKEIKERCRELFVEIDFKAWKAREFRAFLKKKREEEKAIKTYARPYIDYLDKEEKRQFAEFWKEASSEIFLSLLANKSSRENLEPYLNSLKNKGKDHPFLSFSKLEGKISILPPELVEEYLKTFRFYNDLEKPLEGVYRGVRKKEGRSTEKDLAASFYPVYGYGYARSYGYRQAAIQGSLFKIVTAYEALVQRFKKLGSKTTSYQELNPLVIVDQTYKVGSAQYVGYTEEGKPIPQLYKGGRVPRSLAHHGIGKVDLIKAMEVSSNPYFALLASDCLEKPEDLSTAATLFSFGSKTGIDIPGEISGKVPSDLSENRTGLYATSIGQHSLVVTPLQTAVMLAAVGNGGKVVKPRLLKTIEESRPYFGEGKITTPYCFPLQDKLSAVGIDFPLFSATVRQESEKKLSKAAIKVKQQIFLPEVVRAVLLKGLQRSTERTYQDNLNSLVRLYKEAPEAIAHFKEMKPSLLGKTSTSESVETIDLDLEDGTNIYTHVWFGCLSFEQNEDKPRLKLLLKDEFGEPELVVVVYLRYGGYGKEAAPLAAQIVKKWRAIKAKHGLDGYTLN